MPAYQFSPFAIPAAVTTAVVMSFALATVLRRFSRTSMAMLGVAIAVAGFELGTAFMELTTDPFTAVTWARIGSALIVFAGPAIYLFVATILESAPRRTIISVIAWLIAAR